MPMAELLGRWAYNPEVVGSSPTWPLAGVVSQ